MRTAGLEKGIELGNRQPTVPDDGAQGPFGKLFVIRNRDPTMRFLLLPENHVASPLVIQGEADFAEGSHHFATGDDGQRRVSAQAETSTSSSVIAGGIGSSCF